MRIDSNIPSTYANINKQTPASTDACTSTDAVKSVQSPQTMESYRNIVQKPKEELSFDEKRWKDVIEKANKAIVGATCTFEFAIHEKTNEIMVKVIDKDTKEVIREIPPEKVLDMVAKMWEMAGLVVDERR